ncbi:MAG TPA: hypothetical protein VLO07_01165 [Thermoanaerobaculia bacterium]|nr:hypothetical protein [Thermoanaerobaculia bacterium]
MRIGIRVSLLFFSAVLFLAGVAAAADKSLTASGTVSKLQAAERTVAMALADGSKMVFVWDAETRINGTLTPGAKVTVRYTPQADGKNLANQISVVR